MSLKEDGFEIHTDFLRRDYINEILAEIEALGSALAKHGIRNAEKKLVSVNNLVKSNLLLEKASRYLPGKPEVVRVIVFDKTPDKNWLVSWHQDKTVSVSDRKEVEGWGPWTLKEGIHHVQPELKVLEEMVTFRIHLDDADETNGCLKVIPKSHQLGILSKEQQERIVRESQEHICLAKSGDLLVMRPYLLHSSNKGTEPKHRRVVHIEYSCFQLPQGLVWA
ncbi:phytanoyl-CoA dioxygenase family protein [Bowmanella denitrificans]|uniref:phytanoyl-CoA dioxygenase family protein n=1 Tax=Bowmanella denitrificans TaxID=366582 RepID=UPI001FE932BE|nr:phytanoyl-CoA dioxygenase family protein [Bowmanella denitrificans]